MELIVNVVPSSISPTRPPTFPDDVLIVEASAPLGRDIDSVPELIVLHTKPRLPVPAIWADRFSSVSVTSGADVPSDITSPMIVLLGFELQILSDQSAVPPVPTTWFANSGVE